MTTITKDNRMERKLLCEWQILDAFYIFFLLLYLAAEWIFNGKIDDILFLLLLTAATVFLNFRQKKLYHLLQESEDGKSFFQSLYPNGEGLKQLANLFMQKSSDFFALVFATLFATIMYLYILQEELVILKIAFAALLFSANIPTGLAIARIIKYFYYTIQWISRIRFDISGAEYFETRFIKRVRTNVLYTAVLYCTLSLSSILFTDIELNWIVFLYTVFAVSLIFAVLLITDTLIRYKRQRVFHAAYEKTNSLIAGELNQLIYHDAPKDLNNLEFYLNLKDILIKQNEKKFDFHKFLSNIGLVFITVIPIILQWILNSLSL